MWRLDILINDDNVLTRANREMDKNLKKPLMIITFFIRHSSLYESI